MAFTWLNRILGRDQATSSAAGRIRLKPLYAVVVRAARQPQWYLEGGVPDTIDGRFDVLSLVAAQTLLRLEDFGEEGIVAMARFAELFAEDMEGQLREEGHGDVGVGARVESLIGALGGRLGAVRSVRDGEEALPEMLTRNLYRGDIVSPANIAAASAQLTGIASQLSRTTFEELMHGKGLSDG